MSFENRTKSFFGPERALFFGCLILGLTVLAPGLAGAQSDPGHAGNPFDHVGQWHNQGLDSVIEAAAEVKGNPATLTLAGAELAGQFRDQIFGADHVSPPIDEHQVATYFHDSTAFVASIEQRFDDQQRAYYGELRALTGELRPGMSEEEGAAWVEAMKQLELRMLSDMGESRAAVLLAAASVGRYSHAYWNLQVKLGKASPWPGLDDPGSVAERIPSHITADMQGAIAGGIIGAGAGGVGAIPGALEGAVWASLISLAWDWLF